MVHTYFPMKVDDRREIEARRCERASNSGDGHGSELYGGSGSELMTFGCDESGPYGSKP